MIYAFEASLKVITEGPLTLEQRFQVHKAASAKFKAVALSLGFTHVTPPFLPPSLLLALHFNSPFYQVPTDPSTAANGMSALYVPQGIAPAAIIGALGARGVVIAGGLHKDIKTKYIRFGHMGHSITATDHLDQLIKALKEAHAEVAAQH